MQHTAATQKTMSMLGPLESTRAAARNGAPVVNAMSTASRALGSTQHLALFDGLRAYLASWVVVCHAMWVSGFEPDQLNALWAVVCRGEHAVDVFILLSGFVIFKLLDARRESYRVFIVRRFLRLFPVFVLLFVVAIPASRLAQQNLSLATNFFTPSHAAELAAQYREWFQHRTCHVALHLSLLHGLVPRVLLPEAPGAFLEPAWSISLEWQFYLVAPFAYALVTSRSYVRRVAVSLGTLLAFVLAAGGVLPAVDFGAALPFHAAYFFLGAASYFLYKRNQQAPISELPTLAAMATAAFVFQLGHRHAGLIPVCIWVTILGLVLEGADAPWTRVLARPFVHPLAQYIGRISYSLYLCHMIVLYLVQHELLQVAPTLSRNAHCVWLVALTFAVSVPVSALLYRFVETPCVRLGRRFAKRSAPPRVLDSEHAGTPTFPLPVV